MSTPLTNTAKRLVHGDKAPSCNLVIFGAGGDLTRRLLMPALYNLVRTGLLPDRFSLIGVDRQDLTDEGFRDRLDQSVRSFASDKSYSV
jgi:glucose-6-phosphate 1-dehydrogenase